jgi:chromosome segregation ATPase
MALGDYFKGPQHKANAARLEAELQDQHKRSQADLQSLQTKFDQLERKALEIGLLDLLAVQKKIQDQESMLAEAKSNVDAALAELQAADSTLQEVRKQILVAEDTVELETFSLYHP